MVTGAFTSPPARSGGPSFARQSGEQQQDEVSHAGKDALLALAVALWPARPSFAAAGDVRVQDEAGGHACRLHRRRGAGERPGNAGAIERLERE